MQSDTITSLPIRNDIPSPRVTQNVYRDTLLAMSAGDSFDFASDDRKLVLAAADALKFDVSIAREGDGRSRAWLETKFASDGVERVFADIRAWADEMPCEEFWEGTAVQLQSSLMEPSITTRSLGRILVVLSRTNPEVVTITRNSRKHGNRYRVAFRCLRPPTSPAIASESEDAVSVPLQVSEQTTP